MNQPPPHNVEAEEALLGAMLLTGDAIDDGMETVTAEHFYKPLHQTIFQAIADLSNTGQPVDAVTVSEHAGDLNVTAALLMSLMTKGALNARAYAQIVYEHALMRKLITTGHEIVQAGYTKPESAQTVVDDCERLMFEVAQGRTADTTARMSDMIGPTLDDIEAMYDRGDAVTGTPSGFVDLDSLTAGLQPSNLIIVGARPAMGKTSFALNIAAHASMREQLPVLVFSLEMSKLELSKRLLSSEAKVNATAIRNGTIREHEWAALTKGMSALGEAQMWIDDNPLLTVSEMRAKARRLKSKVGGLGLVVVDYLQLMSGRSNAESRQVEISEISRGLKILARELECPVMALSQLSRGLEQRTDKRPMLSDLRESGSLEQDADVVMFLYRDEVYNPDTADMGQAELLVAKHRSGPTGVVRLAWLSHQTRFANMSRNV